MNDDDKKLDLQKFNKQQLLQFLSTCSKQELASLIQHGYEKNLIKKNVVNNILHHDALYESLHGGPYYKKYIKSIIDSTFYGRQLRYLTSIVLEYLPSNKALVVWLWAEVGLNTDNNNNKIWLNDGMNINRYFEKFKVFGPNKNLIKYIKNESTLNNRCYIKFGKNCGFFSKIIQNQCITQHIINGLTISFLFRPNSQNDDDCGGIALWDNSTSNINNGDNGSGLFNNSKATFRFSDEKNNNSLYCGIRFGSHQSRTRLYNNRLIKNKWNWVYVTFTPKPDNSMKWFVNGNMVNTAPHIGLMKYSQINLYDNRDINGDLAWFATWNCGDGDGKIMNAVESFLSDFYHFGC